MKPKTYHDGAAEERRAILRKLRRELKAEDNRFLRVVPNGSTEVVCVLKTLIAWLLERNERYEKRAGGLGRK